MFDFLIFSVLGYLFFDYVRIQSLRHRSYLNTGYFLSTIHVCPLVIGHFIILLLFDPSNYQLITFYNLLIGWNIGYAIVDLKNMYQTRIEKSEGKPPNKRRLRYFASMVFHHFLMIMLACCSFAIVNFDSLDHGIYVTMGYLCEVSTPFLNYIQYHKNDCNRFCQILFAFIFFWCRPVNLSYIWYYGAYQKYGFYSPFSLGTAAVTLLNYYWFYRIYLKGKRMIEEITDEQPITKI